MPSEWFCQMAGQEIGPFSPQQLQAMAKEGRLTPDDPLKQGRNGAWIKAADVEGLFDGDGPWAASAQEAAIPPAKPARRPAPRAQPAPGPTGAARAKPARAVKASSLPVAQALPATPTAARGAAPAPAAAAAPRAAAKPVAAAAATAAPLPIVTDPGTSASRTAGRGTGGGETERLARRKQKEKTIFIGAIVALGIAVLAGVVALIVRSQWGDGTEGKPEGIAARSGKDGKSRPEDLEADIGKKEKPEASKPDSSKPDAGKSDSPKTPSQSPEPAPDDRWHDAAKGSIDRGDLRAKVEAVTLKELTVIRGNKRLKEEFLLIGIRLTNRNATRKVEYTSWNVPAPGVAQVVLRDNVGNTYAINRSGRVQGQLRQESLYPETSVEDLLVFQKPIDPAKIKFLRLQLPAAAFGGKGTLNFEIPVVMLTKTAEEEQPGEEPEERPREKPRPKAEPLPPDHRGPIPVPGLGEDEQPEPPPAKPKMPREKGIPGVIGGQPTED